MNKSYKEKAAEIMLYLPAVFLALKDKRTPVKAKIIAALTVGYALSPIDLVPDFIPVLGYLDDIIILPLMIRLCLKLIPPEIMHECLKKAKNMWANGKPKRWYYAAPIVLIWVLIIALIVYIIIK